MANIWADVDIEDNTLPVIPWLQVKKFKNNEGWGTLTKSHVLFWEPLDIAGELYLENLWKENIKTCITKSNQQQMESLDNATDMYLKHYWNEKVSLTKKM